MAQDRELDQLHDEQDRAFQRRQDAWQAQDNAWRTRKPLQDALDRARDRQQEAYAVQQTAWERRHSAQQDTSRAYEAKQSVNDEQQEAWAALNRLRDNNGPRIGSLREEHDRMFDRIKELSAEIDRAFEWGNKTEAFEKIEEVKQLRSDIRDLPPQWRGLSDEIREAKDVHERASERFKPLQAEFVRLRSISDAAKAAHEAVSAEFQAAKAAKRQAQAEFDAAKAEHERRSEEFRTAKAEHERAKDTFNRRLTELRAEQEQRKDDKRSYAEQAGVPSQYWDDLWVSIDGDGNVNIYFGGAGEPVGEGHGHYAMDSSGYVTYRRDVGEAHGPQNFTDFEQRSTWTPAASQPPDGGIIAGTEGGLDNIVSFKTGGPTGDQTLIADGDFTGGKEDNKKFTGKKGARGHNHYGSKREGGQIDEDRGKYTGPDH